MSDTKSQPLSVELITNCINDLAREIGVMDPDDPGRATVLEELSLLTQLRRGENSQPIRSPVNAWTSSGVK